MAEKTTVMVLKVDLQCPCCYKKVKKILCKFPQIRDQVYDEKGNKVTITVVCCSPEKLRDKICCKGGKVIQSIEIKEPPKPKEPEKPKAPEKPKEVEKPKEAPKPKESEKPKEVPKPKEPEKPKEAPKPKEVEKPKPQAEKPKEAPKAEPPKKPDPAPKAPEPVFLPPKMPEPVPAHGFPPCYPSGCNCGSCYTGYPSGPCYPGYGRPVLPPPSYCTCGCGGYGYGASRGCYVRYDYFSEENQQGCSIM